MPVIFTTHPLHAKAAEMLAAAGELRVATSLDAEMLIAEGCDADVVIVRAPLPDTLFARAPNLRAAIRHGAGLDMIPVEAATAAGVLVANVPGVNARSVAEHVFLVTLALLRRFRRMDRDLREKGWLAGRDHAPHAHDLAGRTIGIFGMGNVGAAVAAVAMHGFGLNVIAGTRDPRRLPDGIFHRDIDTLVAESDILVLCCPLTPQTRGLLDARRIAAMKPDAILVNVSRGPVVADDALIEALRAGRIGGAALDVFSSQPLPLNHPYFSFDNVIITPHMAGITEESMQRMGIGAAQEVLRVLGGGLPENFCNPEVLDAYRERFSAA